MISLCKIFFSVKWEKSDIRWASRWDTYLEMGDVQIHWFSIVNSIVVVFFLAGILAMIIGTFYFSLLLLRNFTVNYVTIIICLL